MKILTIERDMDGVESDAFKEFSKAEAKAVWELQQKKYYS